VGAHGVDRSGDVHGVPLRDIGAGDGVLRGDREEPQGTKGEKGGCASGCVILIIDTLLKVAMIIFWHNVFSVIRLEVIAKWIPRE
jgi:hypothetical protein